MLLIDITCRSLNEIIAMSCANKWLNRSIFVFGCGLQWAEGCTSSIVFTRWRQSVRRQSSVTCAKMANRSMCHLGCGHGRPKEAQVQSYSPGGATCNYERVHCRKPSKYDWTIRYVKLLWPLVIFGHAHLDSRTDSRALRAKYCIVGISHNTDI